MRMRFGAANQDLAVKVGAWPVIGCNRKPDAIACAGDLADVMPELGGGEAFHFCRLCTNDDASAGC